MGENQTVAPLESQERQCIYVSAVSSPAPNHIDPLKKSMACYRTAIKKGPNASKDLMHLPQKLKPRHYWPKRPQSTRLNNNCSEEKLTGTETVSQRRLKFIQVYFYFILKYEFLFSLFAVLKFKSRTTVPLRYILSPF